MPSFSLLLNTPITTTTTTSSQALPFLQSLPWLPSFSFASKDTQLEIESNSNNFDQKNKKSGSSSIVPMDVTELTRVFELFDRNGDGSITKKELSDSLENLGIFIPDADLQAMIDKIDANSDGLVDVNEFAELYKTIMAERADQEVEDEDIKEAFDVFDQNGDGFISVEELREVLVSLGLKQGRTVDDCKQMIGKVDVDGDGRVDLKEFKQMMRRGGFDALI